MSLLTQPFARVYASVHVLYRELAKFGTVGAIAFVVDTGVFNLMRAGIIGGEHGLAEKPLTAKTISVLAATVVAWVGNRYWTFRHRRRASLKREFALFTAMNAGGLAISLACLGFSHYVLGLTSTLADNVAGNGVGLVLGTIFRFWAYRQLVFTTPDEQRLLLDQDDDAGAGAETSADLDQTGESGRESGLASAPAEVTPAASAEFTSEAGLLFADPPLDLDLRDQPASPISRR